MTINTALVSSSSRSLLLLVISLVAATSSLVSATLPSLEKAHNASLLWGTYRPGLYFGMRTRNTPDTLLSGLSWMGVDEFEDFQRIRHNCDQGDNLSKYGWTQHNGRTYGTQEMHDPVHNILLSTTLLKHPNPDKHGGDWSVRITGSALDASKESIVNLFYHFALDSDQGDLSLDNEFKQEGYKAPVILSGSTPQLGPFSLVITEGSEKRELDTLLPRSSDKIQSLDRTHVYAKYVPRADLWKVKEIITQDMAAFAQQVIKDYVISNPLPPHVLQLPNSIAPNANMFIVSKTLRAPFQFDISFVSHSIHNDAKSNLKSIVKEHTGKALTDLLDQASTSYNALFESKFHLAARKFSKEKIAFAQLLTSNMLGGIGYFHGEAIVDRGLEGYSEDEPTDFADEDESDDDYFSDGVGKFSSPKPDPKREGPFSLFTATPSRSFFPRGFLWDEGFHQLLIGTWDNSLSLDIIKSWASNIDKNGWVAREQILGDEARSRVPAEFQIQYPHFANPPTLVLSLKAYLNRLQDTRLHSSKEGVHVQGMGDEETIVSGSDPVLVRDRHLTDETTAVDYLKDIYPAFKRQFEWFKNTQWGDVKSGNRKTRGKVAFRWRGRTPDHTLTSGLDDYPRASPLHPSELHVDLLSWMGFYSSCLKMIATKIGRADDAKELEEYAENVWLSLQDLHWDSNSKTFCDLTIDKRSKSVKLVHKGYISIFPFILRLLPADSEYLDATLDLISDETELWSDYGLASLSKSDPLYGSNENYWRGPIWLNINYLAIRALSYYKETQGPYQQKAADIYKSLRENIIDNVFNEYVKTGFPWEQYSSVDGKGKRSHPFTGWTSLTVLIMAEKYY